MTLLSNHRKYILTLPAQPTGWRIVKMEGHLINYELNFVDYDITFFPRFCYTVEQGVKLF